MESVYRKALTHELRKHRLEVETEVPVAIRYDGANLGDCYADHLVERKVIVEVKSTDGIASTHVKQLLTYLHFLDKRLAS